MPSCVAGSREARNAVRKRGTDVVALAKDAPGAAFDLGMPRRVWELIVVGQGGRHDT